MARFGIDRRWGIAAAGFLFLSCANQVVLEPSVLRSPKSGEIQADFSREPELVWSYNLGDEPSAPAVLFGDILAVPLKNRSVLFVNKNTGKKAGGYDLSGVPAGVVFDGRENLIIAEESGDGELLSYSLVDGGVDWRFALNEGGEVPILKRGEFDPAGTVLAVNRKGWIHALRADDGKPLWTQQLAPLSCTPLGTDTVFHLADYEGKLNLVANGKILQSHKLPSAVLQLEAAEGKLFTGGGDSSISSYSSSDGKLLWKVKTDGKVRSLDVHDSLVFFASMSGTVAACRISDGEKIWERKLETLVNAPLATGPGVVFVSSAEGRFLAHSEAAGEILWERRIPGGPVGRPILEGNTLFIATTGRRLLAFRF